MLLVKIRPRIKRIGARGPYSPTGCIEFEPKYLSLRDCTCGTGTCRPRMFAVSKERQVQLIARSALGAVVSKQSSP